MDPVVREGLAPFVTAQDPVWDSVCRELSVGRKTSHWMWYIFPQLRALGRSERAMFYGLVDLAEAQSYAAHPILGPRLVTASEIVVSWVGDRSAEAIMGPVDALKLRSCATLFASASGDLVFPAILDGFYDGPCPRTADVLP